MGKTESVDKTRFVSIHLNHKLYELIGGLSEKYKRTRNEMMNVATDWFFNEFNDIKDLISIDSDTKMNTVAYLSHENSNRFDKFMKNNAVFFERTELMRVIMFLFLVKENELNGNPNPDYIHKTRCKGGCEYCRDEKCSISKDENRCIRPTYRCSLRIKKIKAMRRYLS